MKGLVGDLVIDSSCRGSELPASAWGGSEPSVALALGSYASDLEGSLRSQARVYMRTCIKIKNKILETAILGQRKLENVLPCVLVLIIYSWIMTHFYSFQKALPHIRTAYPGLLLASH